MKGKEGKASIETGLENECEVEDVETELRPERREE